MSVPVRRLAATAGEQSCTTVLGIDIGTSSSKGVLVDLHGRVLARATRSHQVSRPHPSWSEMDARIWWEEFVAAVYNELYELFLNLYSQTRGTVHALATLDQRHHPQPSGDST